MSETIDDRIDALTKERDEARALAEEACNKYNELQAKNVVTCVYCGHQYEEGTPVSKHEKLTEHIKVCLDHPMRALEERVSELTEALKVIKKRSEGFISNPDMLKIASIATRALSSNQNG